MSMERNADIFGELNGALDLSSNSYTQCKDKAYSSGFFSANTCFQDKNGELSYFIECKKMGEKY